MAESYSTGNLKKTVIPPNDDIINILMSGIKDSLVEEGSHDTENETTTRNENKITVGDNVKASNKGESPSSSLNNVVSDDDDDFNSKTELSDNDKNLASFEEDLVDELAMKDLELTFTDEDRKRLRIEAEVCKHSGNELFKAGQFRESALAYTQALRTCPLEFSEDRAVFYSNRAAAKMKLELNETAIEDCSKALELNAMYQKALCRRAKLYELTDKLDEALADYNKVLGIDPLHTDALCASKRLPEQIQERNEKLKTEMLGKLKDLGNMFLKPFGLSTENFQLSQDPNNGGYSINFKS